MKRQAFTMIELVFVIVMLGILAVVAIPKLATTREDASATAALSSFKTAVNQIQSVATSKGSIPDFTTIVDGNANLTVAVGVITALDKAGGSTCATASIANGTDLVIAVPKTDGGCLLFAHVEPSTTPLLGSSINR
ncbi:MAG: type II secretion system protein [Campylobacterales bacterium]|nr:type II secretion system protein [Campylobacterales bacterium]